MPPSDRQSRQPKARDLNQMARAVMDHIEQIAQETLAEPAAVALGRKGGLKGAGRAMDSLTPAERTRLAEKAAKARWGK